MRPITSVDYQWLHNDMCPQCDSIQGKVGNTYEAGKLNLTRYLTYLSFSWCWLMSYMHICILPVVWFKFGTVQWKCWKAMCFLVSMLDLVDLCTVSFRASLPSFLSMLCGGLETRLSPKTNSLLCHRRGSLVWEGGFLHGRRAPGPSSPPSCCTEPEVWQNSLHLFFFYKS